MNRSRKTRHLPALAAALLLSLVFQTAGAQSSQQNITLDEAIALSIKNSKQLKLSQAKVDEALANVKIANEKQLPEASVSGSYLRLTQPNIDMKMKMGGDNNGGSKESAPKVNSAMYGIASVSVPIFSGFMIRSAKESARYLAKAAQLDGEKDREEVITNTIDAYSNLYKANQAVELVRENLKQSQLRVNDFTNMEKNGLLARNDLLKAQLQHSNVELSLMDAENNLKLANINMNLMLGIPDEVQLRLDTTAFRIDGLSQHNVAEWEQLALQSRKDMASLDAREHAANAGIRSVKGEYFPSLAFTGGYVAMHVPDFLTVTNAVNAGVGLKYNLSSLWKTKSRMAEATAKLNQVKANEAMLTDAIHLQVNQAFQNYLLSVKKIDTYLKAIEQADENFRITKNKQANNLATTTDLLDADVASLQAHLNYAFAKADVVVAYNKLLETTGVLGEKINNKQ